MFNQQSGDAGTSVPGWFANIDTRLVAAVQGSAGARCHQAANLVQSYYLTAQVYHGRLQRQNEQAPQAFATLQQIRLALRKFLSECCVH